MRQGSPAIRNQPLLFFAFAHLAFSAATIFARPSGLRVLLPLVAVALAFGAFAGATACTGVDPLFSAFTLAQRAFCAAMIRSRPSADIPPFLALVAGAVFPTAGFSPVFFAHL